MIRSGWYKVRKYYRGGSGIWGVYVSQKISRQFEDEEHFLSLIGERTDGGSQDGYRIYCRFFNDKKPKNVDDLKITVEVVKRLFVRIFRGEYSMKREKRYRRLMDKLHKRRK